MIVAWACWCYGKVMKWGIIYPLWCFRGNLFGLETRLYNHAVRVRRNWDRYMFKKEARDL